VTLYTPPSPAGEEVNEDFVFPVPEESDEDDEDTALIIPIVPYEEGLAILNANV
jgi:hypothetical protein